MRDCIETATESYDECTEWADHGYSSCTDWDANCCDWWPCSWACKLITWICVAAVWVANVVCVVWTTIVTVVCIAWGVVQVVLAGLAAIVELILAIPIVGRFIDELLNLVTEIVWRVVGLGDALLGLVGIQPLKKLRLCIVILRNEKGTPTSSAAILQPHIDAARRIFREAANVHLYVDTIHTVSSPSPGYALDVGCDTAAWGEDFGLTGAYFKFTGVEQCPLGGLSRVLGYGNQIVIFCVREIPGGTAGCSLGPLSDYVTVEGADPVCIAHELGHACGLWHCCPNDNLANGICGGTTLDWWQRAIVRNSKYVTYF